MRQRGMAMMQTALTPSATASSMFMLNLGRKEERFFDVMQLNNCACSSWWLLYEAITGYSLEEEVGF